MEKFSKNYSHDEMLTSSMEGQACHYCDREGLWEVINWLTIQRSRICCIENELDVKYRKKKKLNNRVKSE